MLESSSSCPNPSYSHIVHSPEAITSLAAQLNYITDTILELKAELTKIKAEVKEIKKQFAVTHLSLMNEIRHSEKLYLSLSTPFQHTYPFQNPNIKNSFSGTKSKNPKEVKHRQKNHQKKNQKKEMDYKQYNLEELQSMFDKEQNP